MERWGEEVDILVEEVQLADRFFAFYQSTWRKLLSLDNGDLAVKGRNAYICKVADVYQDLQSGLQEAHNICKSRWVWSL
jgi:hypothetical protein